MQYAEKRKGEVLRNFSDISKAKRLLGWEPKWEFAKGIEETLKWFAKHSAQGTEARGRRTEGGGHPGEMRSAVVNEFHWAGRSEKNNTGMLE